jgi:transcriptional regulator with XRE-family HTH domain
MSDTVFDRSGWMEDVGRRVRYARKQSHLTQRRLANEAGIPRTTVANIEVGRVGVYADQLWRFAVVLGVPIDKLMPEPV